MRLPLALAALLLLAAPALPAPGLAPPAAPGPVAVGEDPDGNLVVLHAPWAPDHSFACPAPAPCRNGPHQVGFGFYLHGIVLGPLATGAYTSTLDEERCPLPTVCVPEPPSPPTVLNARILACHAYPGTLQCTTTGRWPQWIFFQTCAFAAADGGCFLIHF